MTNKLIGDILPLLIFKIIKQMLVTEFKEYLSRVYKIKRKSLLFTMPNTSLIHSWERTTIINICFFKIFWYFCKICISVTYWSQYALFTSYYLMDIFWVFMSWHHVMTVHVPEGQSLEKYLSWENWRSKSRWNSQSTDLS